MLIDGKKIRDEILAELKNKFESIGCATLAVVWVGDDPATAKFIEQKKKVAEKVGVELRLFEYRNDIAQTDLEQEINRLTLDAEINGVIVQLPLPKTIDTQKIIDLIPPAKDVDALGKESIVLSPVAGAVAEILKRYEIDLTKNKFVVVGKGKLVGQPVAIWLAGEGAYVSILDSKTEDIITQIKQADVIISGIGRPNFIVPEIVKDGVVLIDAGTSEQAGKLAGDIDPACTTKASLFTPVPGGVGPIVLARLFSNLADLMKKIIK
jgi:methylenetetrahydrofolate dehydrogenase (NADP+) / methenyltetrahydrofolate cyclohydrolase